MPGNYYWVSLSILILVKSFLVPDLFTSIKQPILSRLENEFEPISRNLYKEFIIFKIIPEDIIWDHIQIKFFESHHYFTGTSISKRNEKKLKHLNILKERSNWAQ